MIEKKHIIDKKPNLFLVGAPKCGTTSLYYALKEHAHVFVPKIKEPNYFTAKLLNSKTNYYKSSLKIEYEANYLKIYNESKNEIYRLDASVSYFSRPMIAENIKRFSENAKVIIMVRNPIERLISHYLMDKRLGLVKDNLPRILKDTGQEYSEYKYNYLVNGQYKKHIEIWEQTFGKANTLVLNIDLGMQGVFTEVSNFLSLQNPLVYKQRAENESFDFNSHLLRNLYQVKLFRRAFKSILSSNIKSKLLKKASKKPVLGIDQHTQEFLHSYYANENEWALKRFYKKFWNE